MPRAAPLLAVLAFVGLLKAGVVVWVGAKLGLAMWVVTIAAAAWAIAPAAAGWLTLKVRARVHARAGRAPASP